MRTEAQSVLIRSNGAQLVTLEGLQEFKAPPPSGRWYPLSHHTVMTTVLSTLDDAGFRVSESQLAVSRGGDRFFGTLNLESQLTEGVILAVGVRNSVDQSFPIAFCAGNRVMVCENLAFHADLLVSRRHTKHGATRFSADIMEAVGNLDQFKKDETRRIEVMKTALLSNERAESLILRSLDKGIITSHEVMRVLREWREPEVRVTQDCSYWALLNAFTWAMKSRAESNPSKYAALTMRLSAHLTPTELTLAV